jgi:hypothetical protein
MSFPKKLYVDSRYRSSGTHSDFSYSLQTSIEVPHGYVALIDSVSIPNVFLSVDENRNKLYVRLVAQTDRILTLRSGMYNGITLAAELQAQLNTLGPEYGTYTVTYETGTGQLTVAMAGLAFMSFLERDASRPYDCLEVIGVDPIIGQSFTDGVPVTLAHHVDVVGVRVLYLTSSNFGHYSSLGPRGESDILRQIMVTEGNGSYIVDRLVNPFEFIECGGQQLQTLNFRLVDGSGRIVDMKGRSICFSIIFLLK